MQRDFKDNPLIQHCLKFSLEILAFAQVLEHRKKFILANQLIKSATSIGANVMEAQSAESSADFYHKLKIADKEACETWYWLYLCEHAADYPFEVELQIRLKEIMAILNKILSNRGIRK